MIDWLLNAGLNLLAGRGGAWEYAGLVAVLLTAFTTMPKQDRARLIGLIPNTKRRVLAAWGKIKEVWSEGKPGTPISQERVESVVKVAFTTGEEITLFAVDIVFIFVPFYYTIRGWFSNRKAKS